MKGLPPGWDAIPSYSSPYLSVPIYMAEWREGLLQYSIYPWSTVTGQGLNLDCSILIFPACRPLVRPHRSLNKIMVYYKYLLKIYQNILFLVVQLYFLAVFWRCQSLQFTFICTDTYQSNLIHSCYTIQHCKCIDLFHRTLVAMLVNQGSLHTKQRFHHFKQLYCCSCIHEPNSTSTWYSTWKLHSSKYTILLRTM